MAKLSCLISAACEVKRLNRPNLAKLIGVSNKTLDRWSAGRSAYNESLRLVAKGLGISVDDLNHLLSDSVQDDECLEVLNRLVAKDEMAMLLLPTGVKKVGIVDVFPVGGKMSTALKTGEIAVDYPGVLPKEAWGIRVESDSMSPTLTKGEYAIFDSERAAHNGDIVAAEYKGEAYIRRYICNGDRVTLVAEHPDKQLYPNIEVADADTLRIVAVCFYVQPAGRKVGPSGAAWR